MAETAKKRNYVKGSAKEVVFNNGGNVIHIDLLLEDLKRLPINAAGYIKLTVSKLAAPDKYNNTHTIYENDWKPAGKSGDNSAPKAPASTKPTGLKTARSKDDLPF